MGRRGAAKRTGNTAYGSNNTISLREELTGKKQTKGPAVNAKTALKLEHLQRLAVWAGGEASVPSLGAFFAHTLASAQEALGVPPDPSLFTCQRCETILQPGLNCTVRIEKNRSKKRRKSKKPTSFSQNNVVYTCHFCSHRNLKRGTPHGHMKVICPAKTKTTLKLKPAKSISQKFVSSKKSIVAEDEVRKANEIAASEIIQVNEIASSEITREIQANEIASSEIVREIQGNETASSEIAREIQIQVNETASSEIAREIQEKETASLEIARENCIVETRADEDEVTIVNEMASSAIAGEIPTVDSPETPKFPFVFTRLGSSIIRTTELSLFVTIWRKLSGVGFRRNLNERETVEVIKLLETLEGFRLCASKRDRRRWDLEESGSFTCKSFQSFLRNKGRVVTFHPFSLVWKAKSPPKVKVFVWLVALGKVNTLDLVQRKGPFMYLSPQWCVLCKHCEENVDHLFLHCPFSLSLWGLLWREVGTVWVIPKGCSDFLCSHFVVWGKGKRASTLWGCLVHYVFWNISLERNRRIFEDYKGAGVSELWDRVKYWVALWASITKEFKDYSYSTIMRDMAASVN
ncbi:unnamed protein product [Prunus armeniaca]